MRIFLAAAIIAFFVGLIGASWGWSMPTPPQKKPFRVVLDPGHGGSDFGTVYQGGSSGKSSIAEKDMALLLAVQAAEKLRKKGYLVFLTREKDEDVPLPVRTAFANRVKADVFISIHLNSSTTPMVSDPGGVETYILNNTTNASSERLAYVENRMSSVSKKKLTKSAEAEVDDLSLILKDLRLDANMTESRRLACALQGQLVQARQENLRKIKSLRKINPGKTGPAHNSVGNRGVRQALFYVLLGADMPSALLEVGFMTSPQDRALMLSTASRERMSLAIARSVELYKHSKTSAKLMSELSSCKVN